MRLFWWIPAPFDCCVDSLVFSTKRLFSAYILNCDVRHTYSCKLAARTCVHSSRRNEQRRRKGRVDDVDSTWIQCSGRCRRTVLLTNGTKSSSDKMRESTNSADQTRLTISMMKSTSSNIGLALKITHRSVFHHYRHRPRNIEECTSWRGQKQVIYVLLESYQILCATHLEKFG